MPYSYPTTNTELMDRLGLKAHHEGGYYAETLRAEESVPSPFADGQLRPLQTTIYYLLSPKSPNGYFHMNKSTTMHVLHQGRSQYTLIYPPDARTDGKTVIKKVVMGEGPEEVRQLYVEGGVWKASKLLPEDIELAAHGDVDSERIGCLITEVVTPGFHWDDHKYMDKATMDELLASIGDATSQQEAQEIATHVKGGAGVDVVGNCAD